MFPLLINGGSLVIGRRFSVSRYRCGSRRFDSPHALPLIIRGSDQNADRQRLSFCEVSGIITIVFQCVLVVRVTLIPLTEFRFSYDIYRKKRRTRLRFVLGRPIPVSRSVVFGTQILLFGTTSAEPCFQGIRRSMLKCCRERIENQCTHSLTTPSGGGVWWTHIGITVKSRTEFCTTPVSGRRKNEVHL